MFINKWFECLRSYKITSIELSGAIFSFVQVNF